MGMGMHAIVMHGHAHLVRSSLAELPFTAPDAATVAPSWCSRAIRKRSSTRRLSRGSSTRCRRCRCGLSQGRHGAHVVRFHARSWRAQNAQCPFMTKCFDAFEDAGWLWLVLENSACGDLYSILNNVGAIQEEGWVVTQVRKGNVEAVRASVLSDHAPLIPEHHYSKAKRITEHISSTPAAA